MIEVYKNSSEITLAARLALDHCLFVPGWELCSRLRSVAGYQSRYTHTYGLKDCYAISMYYDKEVSAPVAICVVWENFCYEAAFFVKEEYRRNKIATQLFDAICNKMTDQKNIYCFKGNDASVDFFHALMTTNKNVTFDYDKWRKEA